MNPFDSDAPKPTRTPQTQADYERLARAWLRRIDHRLPLSEALVRTAERGPLRVATKRRYKAICRTTIEICIDEGLLSAKEAGPILDRMIEVVAAARRPTVHRTSSGKTLDFDARDHRAVVEELERRENARGDGMIARCATLFTMILPALGCRPHEAWGIVIMDDGVLCIPTCKATNGRSDGADRQVSIASFPPTYDRSIAEFVRIVERLRALRYDQHKLERAVAARLARASRAVLGRVMCPYALRHIAIAIWRSGGVGDDAIKTLLGHRSPLTARRWYARLGKGWRWCARTPIPVPLPRSPSAAPPAPTDGDASVLSTMGFR